MTDLTDNSFKTLDAIKARYAKEEYPMACRVGALEALVTRLAIQIDVQGDNTLKAKIDQILLGYQLR